ncbi:hypothetical protein RSSM_03063 [Rhodopirellula sallentina SM41]|uniref:Uncharacterized protein n=1 Tax=Rhodopirellula sallentina SM41 TaxID=1263870 RepID=M5U2J5_9BACT|nr:hypothetical protein RSSM_03063 [Rhodopirellula sallentina SM41]
MDRVDLESIGSYNNRLQNAFNYNSAGRAAPLDANSNPAFLLPTGDTHD